MKVVKETIWNIVEHVTVRTLLERFKASGDNPHCMDDLQFAADIHDELRDFSRSWVWIQSQNPDKKLYVVDYVEQNTYLT